MGCQIICNLRECNHVSSAMGSLHWLRIHKRITYKLCLLVYKCHNNLVPKYLLDILPSRATVRLLRSSKSGNIQTAYFKNSQHQQSLFSSAGPTARNSLPTMVKIAQPLNSFNASLKTHLFKVSYDK